VSRENLARDHPSIRDSGIQDLEIYLFGTRTVVVMGVNEHFSFDAKVCVAKTESGDGQRAGANFHGPLTGCSNQ
jgi:hypothetical protein